MKTKEREMLAIANDEWFEGSLIEEEYQYCRWDAKDDDCIVEFKHRNKHYDTWIIEFDKYIFNLNYAILNNLQFFYITGTDSVIDCFNIIPLKNKDVFKWKWMDQPETTEFGNPIKIKKYVAFLEKEHRYDTVRFSPKAEAI